MDTKLTEQQIKFIDYLVFCDDTRGDAYRAKKKAGYSDNVSVGELLDKLQEPILSAINTYLVGKASIAARNLADIVSSEDPMAILGGALKHKASSDILDRVGIVKKERLEIDNKMPVALLILPEKQTN